MTSKQYAKEWREKNRDKLNQYQRNWYKTRKDEVLSTVPMMVKEILKQLDKRKYVRP